DCVVDMAGQSSVVNLCDFRTPGAPLRNAHCILVAAPHAHVEGFQPTLEQPARKRIWSLPPHDHLVSHFVDVCRSACDNSAKNVSMTVQVFRRRVNHYIGAARYWSRVDRARQRRVHNQCDTLTLCEGCELVEIQHSACGINRRLDENRPRILSYRAAPDSSLVGIGERDLDSHRYEFFG